MPEDRNDKIWLGVVTDVPLSRLKGMNKGGKMRREHVEKARDIRRQDYGDPEKYQNRFRKVKQFEHVFHNSPSILELLNPEEE